MDAETLARVRVLCVDDEPLDRELIREALAAAGDEFLVAEAHDRHSFEARLAEGCDIVLTDFNILGFEGLEVLEIVLARCPGLPVVLVTGTGSEAVAVESLKRGAADYVIKSRQHISRLPHTIRRVLAARATARALEDSRARFAQLFEHSTSGIAIYEAVDDGADFLFVDINPAGERISQTERAQLIGQRLTLAFPGIEALGLVEILRRAWRTGEEGYLAPRYYRDARLERAVENRVFKLPSGEVVAFFDDVAELVAARAAVDEREAALRRLIEHNADGMVVVDVRGRIRFANPAAELILGRPAAALVGGELGIPLVAGQATETEIHRPGAPPVLVELRLVDTQWEGQPASLASLRDVTERRQLQASLAQADRLSSMGMLAAGVAHEINNPLTYVLYNLESLLEEAGRLSAGQRLDAAAIEELVARATDSFDGTRRISDIVRGLSTFSRAETDEPAAVDLGQVIGAAANMAANEIKYRARLVKEYEGSLSVWGTEGRLSQVLLNLLINAAHAVEEGDVAHNEIRIRTWRTGDEVFVEVSDTGRGVAPEHLDRLFEPFFTTKGVGVGSGLGLSISRNIVEGLGGRIEVASEVGVGTRFVVVLAACDDAAGAGRPRAEQHAGPAVKGRVLVIDDESRVRAALRRVFDGHTLIEAANGEEARVILEHDQAFDLIICDMMMPQVSGMDVHRWLTQRDAELASRVVFLTGGAFTPAARSYLATVENRTMDKPFDAQQLRELLRERLCADRG